MVLELGLLLDLMLKINKTHVKNSRLLFFGYSFFKFLNMMKIILYKIPFALLYSRLAVAITIVVCSFITVKPYVVVLLSVYAVLSDVFDGVIARRLNIANPEMRQLDTKIDTVFWFSCLWYLCLQHATFITSHGWQVIILVMTELFIIILGQLKFQKRISFHTYLAKAWTLTILWFFIEVVLINKSGYSFQIVFWYGLLVQMEIFLIALILEDYRTDISGIWQVLKSRNNALSERN